MVVKQFSIIGCPCHINCIPLGAFISAATHAMICFKVPDDRFDLHVLLERLFKSALIVAVGGNFCLFCRDSAVFYTPATTALTLFLVRLIKTSVSS